MRERRIGKNRIYKKEVSKGSFRALSKRRRRERSPAKDYEPGREMGNTT